MSDRVEPVEVWRCGAGVDRWWGSAGRVSGLRWRTDEVVKIAGLLMGVSGARFSKVEEAAAMAAFMDMSRWLCAGGPCSGCSGWCWCVAHVGVGVCLWWCWCTRVAIECVL
eukprot:7197301-Prorocentrum_lima.AAC.1